MKKKLSFQEKKKAWEESDGKGRYGDWCGTLWDKEPVFDKEIMTFLVYNHEECPETGRLHYQTYVEFKRTHSLKNVREILGNKRCELQPRFGSQESCIKYCTKSETQIAGPFKFGKPKEAGHRSDLDSICDAMNSGMTSKEILLKFKGNALRHISHIQRGLRSLYNFDEMDTFIRMSRSNEDEPIPIETFCEEVAGNTEPPPLGGVICVDDRLIMQNDTRVEPLKKRIRKKELQN